MVGRAVGRRRLVEEAAPGGWLAPCGWAGLDWPRQGCACWHPVSTAFNPTPACSQSPGYTAYIDGPSWVDYFLLTEARPRLAALHLGRMPDCNLQALASYLQQCTP